MLSANGTARSFLEHNVVLLVVAPVRRRAQAGASRLKISAGQIEKRIVDALRINSIDVDAPSGARDTLQKGVVHTAIARLVESKAGPILMAAGDSAIDVRPLGKPVAVGEPRSDAKVSPTAVLQKADANVNSEPEGSDNPEIKPVTKAKYAPKEVEKDDEDTSALDKDEPTTLEGLCETQRLPIKRRSSTLDSPSRQYSSMIRAKESSSKLRKWPRLAETERSRYASVQTISEPSR